LYDEQHLPHYGQPITILAISTSGRFTLFMFVVDCRVFSYVDATGMTAVRNQFSLMSLYQLFHQYQIASQSQGAAGGTAGIIARKHCFRVI